MAIASRPLASLPLASDTGGAAPTPPFIGFGQTNNTGFVPILSVTALAISSLLTTFPPPVVPNLLGQACL